MIRYYLSPVIGAGTNDDPPRPAFTDTWSGNWVGIFGAGNIALVLVNAPEIEHQKLRSDSRIWAFPRQLISSERPDKGGRDKPDMNADLNHVLQRPIPDIVKDSLAAKAVELGFDLPWINTAGYTVAELIKSFGENIQGIGSRADEMWVSE